MGILINILLVIYMLVAVLMMLVILMQRPKSEGLGAAFGGGVTENIFGAQTTNVLTKITGWFAGIFFILTFVLSILYAQRSVGGGGLRREIMKNQPAAAVSPAAPVTSASAAAAAASAAGAAVIEPGPLAPGPAAEDASPAPAPGAPEPAPATSAAPSP